METTYDQSCYDLALSFVEDSRANPMEHPALAHNLAKAIQQTIEDFMEEEGV